MATHWITDALAGDDSIEFSMLQALLRDSSEPFAGAPEAVHERLALRSLQELSSLIPAGGDAAPATARVLRVDGARSCKDVFFRLATEIEISGKFKKDLLPPYRQDIQETIRTKKITLPETLLKGVDAWITSMTPHSQSEHNGTADQSLQNSHGCVNIVKPVFPTDNAEVQQETMTNSINEGETGNLQKDSSVPTSVLHQPCTPKSRSYVPLQEDTMDAVGLGARSRKRSLIVEGNMSVGFVLASAGCDTPLQGSIIESFSQFDKHDHTATVEPKSRRQKSPNLPHCADEGADDGGSSNQSSKVSSHEGLSAHATVTPGFDRISDVLPTDASEPGHLPECITAQDTTMISQPVCRKAHLSALQHERGEKVNQDLEDVSASTRPLEEDHVHGDLTLQSPSALLSVSCNGANQGSKSGTNLQPGTATEDSMAFEEQNADKSCLEFTGANKDPEKKQHAGDKGLVWFPPVDEADQEDSLTASNQSGGKRSSPPSRNMRHSKKMLQEKESAVPSKSGKGIAKQDQHMPTSPRKRSYVRPQKRYSNPLAPNSRRKRVNWTKEEEAILREAMEKFTPQDDARIPWIQIREYGRHVFHEERLPDDLRVKWRSMKGKELAGY